MNCLTCRRLLLGSPREQSIEQRSHIAACEACARLLAGLADLDRIIEEAALVPVPDALAHRVLLERRRKPLWHYAAAAAIVLALALSVLVPLGVLDGTMLSPVQAVGPTHPAVAAISLVLDGRAELAQSGDNAEMNHRLKQLGLALKKGDVHAYYAGKCHLASGECDLIVLDTPDARANVVLVLDYPSLGRALVSDRRMIALVSPARTGGYIVVAESPKVAKRMQRLFVRG